MNHIGCYLCGANDYTVLFPGNFNNSELTTDHVTARKGNVTKEISYRWVKCRRCNLVYANPAPDVEMLAQLYATSDQSEYNDETKNIAATYGAYLYKYGNNIANKNLALDIGAGNGFFLRTLLDFGYTKVIGIEPSVKACLNAPDDVRPFLLNKMFSEEYFAPESLDFISCFQTLEHVPDPNALLVSISRLLAPEGIIYCIAHNFGSLGVRIFGEKHPIVNAGHLTLFDDKTIAAMFAKYFDVIAVFPIRNKYSIRYWLSLVPLNEKVKTILVKMCSLVDIDRASLTMSLGNMGIIAKKRL
jgi:SAM-dependent methyltransferase